MREGASNEEGGKEVTQFKTEFVIKCQGFTSWQLQSPKVQANHKRVEKGILAAIKEDAGIICKTMFSLNEGHVRILFGKRILS